MREPIREAVGGEAVRVAFSYSHKDEELRDGLETHLKLLPRLDHISTWHDRTIMPGDKWAGVIDDSFRRADLILLLVSADFLASDYCYEIEMKTALERNSKSRSEGGARDSAGLRLAGRAVRQAARATEAGYKLAES